VVEGARRSAKVWGLFVHALTKHLVKGPGRRNSLRLVHLNKLAVRRAVSTLDYCVTINGTTRHRIYHRVWRRIEVLSCVCGGWPRPIAGDFFRKAIADKGAQSSAIFSNVLCGTRNGVVFAIAGSEIARRC